MSLMFTKTTEICDAHFPKLTSFLNKKPEIYLKKALWTEAGRSPDEFASFMRTCLCKCFAQNLDAAFPEIKRGCYVMRPEKTIAHLMHNYTIEYTKIIDLN